MWAQLQDGVDDVTTTLLWVLSVALIVIGVAGTVLPALPGTILVLAGIWLGAWIGGFAQVGGWTLGIITVLAVVAWVMDYVAGLLGAKKVGASKLAILGAAIGTVVGLFMGIIGILFMPLVGAAIGEYLDRNDHQRAVKVGVATWLGIMLGMIAKVVIVFMMIGLFVVALLF
jgi:uncharacterized protein